MRNSLSHHYLNNHCTHLTQIWYMDVHVSHEYTGWVQIRFWSNDFWQSYAYGTWEVRNSQFCSLIFEGMHIYSLYLLLFIIFKKKIHTVLSLNLVQVWWFLTDSFINLCISYSHHKTLFLKLLPLQYILKQSLIKCYSDIFTLCYPWWQ